MEGLGLPRGLTWRARLDPPADGPDPPAPCRFTVQFHRDAAPHNENIAETIQFKYPLGTTLPNPNANPLTLNDMCLSNSIKNRYIMEHSQDIDDADRDVLTRASIFLGGKECGDGMQVRCQKIYR